MEIPAAIGLSLRFFREAAQLRSKIDEKLQRECAISLPEKELLVHLKSSEQGLRMSDISERLLFTHGGANKLVGRLVDRKLVHRQRSESDQRVMTVKITDLGADVLSQAVPIMTETVESFWNQGLSKVDQEIFARLLKQLGLHYDD